MAIRDITKYTRPKYIESPYSVDTYVGILKTPTLSIDTNNKLRLSWTNIDPNTQLYELEYSYNSGSWEIYDNPISTATTYDLPDNLPDGTYKFRIRATATIIDSNFHSHDFYSAWSNETTQFTVKTLKKCTIESVNGNSQYYISNIDTDADYYILTITKDNVSSNKIQFDKNEIPTSNNPYNLDYYEAGTYVLTATAYNNNEYLFHNATSSNTQTYSVVKLEIPVLRDDKFNKDNPQVDWDPITNANGYSIYLNNIEINPSYAGTTYNFKDNITPDVLNYSTKIKAVRSGQIKYANPKYLNSEFSNEIKFGTLPDPILGLSSKSGQDNIIEILNKDKFINAEEFEVYDVIGGKQTLIIKIPVSESKYALESSVPKTFNIRMKAISSSKNIINSGLSNLITYSFVQLSKPSIQIINSEKNVVSLKWNKIQNADFYDLYINYEFKQKVIGTEYTLTLPVGNNAIYIIARSNFKKFLDSDRSNLITQHQDATADYQVKINNTSYNMVLPFTFNETLDESMDSATAITIPIAQKEPFEAFSEVEVWVNETFMNSDGIEVHKALPGFPKYMILSQDDVKEVQLGEASLFQHNLNLIERTKLLESELLPDLSITQPMEYAQKINEINPELSLADFGNNNIFKNREIYLPTGDYWWWAGIFLRRDFVNVYGITESAIKGNLYNIYRSGDIIKLPYETATDFKVYSQTTGITGSNFAPVFFNSVNDYGIKLRRTYKYRSHSESYDVDPNNPEQVIGITYDNTPLNWNTKDLPTGEYDIILEIDLDDADWKKLKKELHYEGKGQLNFMYDIDEGLKKHNWNDSPYDLSKLKKYRVVWGTKTNGITISKLETPDQTDHSIKWEAKNLIDAMNKVLKAVEPLIYGDKPKYTLDPRLSYLSSTMCPELKFYGGKSLYEVFTTFGRLFYGIPRLGCLDSNNIYHKDWITFDVLDNASIINLIHTTFKDKNNLETMKSSIDNHSTGYISNISNMITNDYYTTYPAGSADDSKSIWISPRSGAESDTVANKDNMAIVLDKPIYRLVSVLVKNFDPKQPSRYIDIKDYVFEETNFQALNSDAEGKGIAIYYKQGDNRILGLGNIPQASRSQAAWNVSPDEYIIQRIIRYRTGMTISSQSNPNSFKYKVIYVPYIDARVFTEQSNISNLKNYSYKNLNQEDNVIFDKYFGKSAQTQVERLGNNSISKNYREINILNLPTLGQTKEFEGYTYYADDITYIYNNNYIDCTVNFSKNFNKINERVGIDAEYRLFRIYANDYTNRHININKYCYLSFVKYKNDIDTMKKTNYHLLENLKTSINDGNNKCSPHRKPDAFYIRNFKNNTELLQYKDYDGKLQTVPCNILSADYNTFNNSVMFSGKFIDNYSAGIKAASVWNQQRVQQDVRYVDNNGENQIMGITLCNLDNSQLNISADRYPEASYIATPYTLNNALFSEKIDLDKDNRECINMSYQLHFQTYNRNITIHRGIINNLYYDEYRLDLSKDEYKQNTPKYAFFKGDISKQDNINLNQYQKTNSVSVKQNNADGTVSIDPITVGQIKDDYDGFALVYDSGEIMFSVRQQIKKGSTFTIPTLYFNFSDNKINYQPK